MNGTKIENKTKNMKKKKPKHAGATSEGGAVDDASIVVIEAARAVLGETVALGRLRLVLSKCIKYYLLCTLQYSSILHNTNPFLSSTRFNQ